MRGQDTQITGRSLDISRPGLALAHCGTGGVTYSQPPFSPTFADYLHLGKEPCEDNDYGRHPR